MSEKEYIAAKDLGHIISACDCLKHIVPKNSDVVKPDEYEKVMSILSDWKENSFKKIKIEYK